MIFPLPCNCLQSLYLQPNLYDEVSHERHLAMICSYPTCNKRPRRAYSEDARWRITNTTTHNVSLRGSNKRDVVQVAGNPEDGFCSPACAIRSRWFRSRLDLEPVWARQNIDVGDLKAYQAHAGNGRLPDPVPDEVDLLEDMEERGEIVIEDGQIRRLESTLRTAGTMQNPAEVTQDTGSEKEENDEGDVTHQKTEPLPKTQLVAETRAQPSTFMQRLENTLAGLRIVEKTASTEQSPSERPISDESQHSTVPPNGTTSVAVPGSERTGTPLAGNTSADKGDESKTLQPTPGSTSSRSGMATRRQNGQMGSGRESDFEDESEDEETQKVFALALAARKQLEDGNF